MGEVGISAKTREARIERRATSSSRSVGEFLRCGRTFAGVGVLENMADATVTCHVRWVHSPRASGVVCGAVAPGSVRGGARVKTRADARGGAARCALIIICSVTVVEHQIDTADAQHEIDPSCSRSDVFASSARDCRVLIGGVRPRDTLPPGVRIRTLTRRRFAEERLECAAWSRARRRAGITKTFIS